MTWPYITTTSTTASTASIYWFTDPVVKRFSICSGRAKCRKPRLSHEDWAHGTIHILKDDAPAWFKPCGINHRRRRILASLCPVCVKRYIVRGEGLEQWLDDALRRTTVET